MHHMLYTYTELCYLILLIFTQSGGLNSAHGRTRENRPAQHASTLETIETSSSGRRRP